MNSQPIPPSSNDLQNRSKSNNDRHPDHSPLLRLSRQKHLGSNLPTVRPSPKRQRMREDTSRASVQPSPVSMTIRTLIVAVPIRRIPKRASADDEAREARDIRQDLRALPLFP